MEKGLKAFFYDYKYYLLPETVADASELNMFVFKVKRLKEEGCMAPDFVYESIVTETLVIRDRRKVFPVTVNLYTQEEYDALLSKQVQRLCPGCLRYSEEGGSLEGHHREISLAGACYSRMDAREEPSFSACAGLFWDFVAENVNRLAAWTDKGAQKEINRFLNAELTRFFLPLEFFCGEEDGRYCLCMSACGYTMQSFRLVTRMLADTAALPDSPMQATGWKVYPYFPKKIYRPKIRPDYFKHPPRLFVSGGDGESISLALYEKNAARWSERQRRGRKLTAYKYLCSVVGEDLLLAGSEVISFVETVPKNFREVAPENLADELYQVSQEFFGEKVPFPPPVFLRSEPIAGGEEDALPYKRKTEVWMTLCIEMGPERPAAGAGVQGMILEELGLNYAYIFFPGVTQEGPGAKNREIWDEYFVNIWNYPPPITRAEDREIFSDNVGISFSEAGMCIDFMVFDEKEFFRVLRNLAPVLMEMRAKIVTVKRDGVIVYDPGYVMLPEDSGMLA